jgi:large subunit ribosomal protein L24e
MNCSFCKTEMKPGTGTLYVTKDGKKFWFCGSKCEKNQLKLNRIARNQRWISKNKPSSS